MAETHHSVCTAIGTRLLLRLRRTPLPRTVRFQFRLETRLKTTFIFNGRDHTQLHDTMKNIILFIQSSLALLFFAEPEAIAQQAHVEVVQTGTNFTYTVFNDEAAGSAFYL